MTDLTKSIGLWRGTSMMLNIVLGAGLLTLPGLAAQAAGTGALTIWIACALATLPLLAVFAILGRSYPDSGGIATFLQRAFGDFGYVPATFLLFGAVSVGLPSIALAGGHYAASAFGGSIYVYASLLILGAMAANLASAEIAGRINTVIASSLVLVLIAMAVVGWMTVKPTAAVLDGVFHPALDLETFGLAFMMVFFAFTGWEVASTLGGEFRNPERDLPLAIGLSFVIAVILYLTLAVIVAAAGPEAAVEAPFTAILGRALGPGASQAVALIAVLMIFANLSAAIWAVSRMVYSASQEEILPESLSRLNGGVPLNAVFLTVGVLLSVVGLVSLGYAHLSGLLASAGLNLLLLYGGGAAALFVLAKKPSHRVLAGIATALVALLIAGRGLGALHYPAILIVAGAAVAVVRGRGPRQRMFGRRPS